MTAGTKTAVLLEASTPWQVLTRGRTKIIHSCHLSWFHLSHLRECARVSTFDRCGWFVTWVCKKGGDKKLDKKEVKRGWEARFSESRAKRGVVGKKWKERFWAIMKYNKSTWKRQGTVKSRLSVSSRYRGTWVGSHFEVSIFSLDFVLRCYTVLKQDYLSCIKWVFLTIIYLTFTASLKNRKLWS